MVWLIYVNKRNPLKVVQGDDVTRYNLTMLMPFRLSVFLIENIVAIISYMCNSVEYSGSICWDYFLHLVYFFSTRILKRCLLPWKYPDINLTNMWSMSTLCCGEPLKILFDKNLPSVIPSNFQVFVLFSAAITISFLRIRKSDTP